MAYILTRHVTHWACLGCSGSTCMTECFSSRQYPAASHRHWRGVGQHSTGHNHQPDQLYAKEMCYTAWGKWSHQILTGFLIHGLHFFKGICDQQMHICIPSYLKYIDQSLMHLFKCTDFQILWQMVGRGRGSGYWRGDILQPAGSTPEPYMDFLPQRGDAVGH